MLLLSPLEADQVLLCLANILISIYTSALILQYVYTKCVHKASSMRLSRPLEALLQVCRDGGSSMPTSTVEANLDVPHTQFTLPCTLLLHQ